MTSKPLIDDELARFIESGLSVTAASRDSELQAEGAVAWAVRVEEDRVHAAVYLHENAAPLMLRNLREHPEFAVLVDRPSNHRACQLKGIYVSSRRARAAERAEIERQANGFRAELEAIGIPRAMTVGWKLWPCVAIRFRVTHLYEQTPGPGAGEPLR